MYILPFTYLYLPAPLYGNKCYYMPLCGGWPHGRAHVYMCVHVHDYIIETQVHRDMLFQREGV